MSSRLVSSSSAHALGLSIASSLVVTFAACGGSVNNGSLGDGGARGDASMTSNDDNGNGVSGPCPASAPLPGASCDRVGLTCEYGGEGPYLACSAMATCGNDKRWISNGGGAQCTASQRENEAACPSSYDALAPGAACPTINGACVYPEGKCGCASCFSEEAGGPQKGWSCIRWPSPAGCPQPRPRIGSSCAVDGQKCNYATYCSAVSTGLPDLTCANGLWQQLPSPPQPCPFPTCER